MATTTKRPARSSARPGGERAPVAQVRSPRLQRHEIDGLYGAMIAAGIAGISRGFDLAHVLGSPSPPAPSKSRAEVSAPVSAQTSSGSPKLFTSASWRSKVSASRPAVTLARRPGERP
jgi:hypothetical protein